MRDFLPLRRWPLLLLCALVASASASSPVYKGGVVKAVDLKGKSFTVSDCIVLGYDWQGAPGKPGDLTIKFELYTLFLLDGVPVAAEEALKAGHKLKRAFTKGGGFVELFTPNSLLLDPANAALSLGCIMVGEKDGKTGPTGASFALRLNWQAGRLARAFAVANSGGRPGLYLAEQKMDASNLTFTDGKLTGEAKVAGAPTLTVTLDATVSNAVVRGSFKGTQDGQAIQGCVNGEFDYPEPKDAPVTAYTVLMPGWDGGAATASPILVTLTSQDGAAVAASLAPYNGAAKLTALVGKVDVRLKPNPGGTICFKLDSDAHQSGLYTLDLARNTGSMGMAGAVGAAYLCQPGTVGKEGATPQKATPGIFVRNARRLLSSP